MVFSPLLDVALTEMLTAYRSTPHPATGKTPYQLMMNRDIRIKLDHTGESLADEDIQERDLSYKWKAKIYADEHRHAKEHTLQEGDHVLLKQPKINKYSTTYEPTFYEITKVLGSQVTAQRVTDGRTVCRDASHFKAGNGIIQEQSVMYRPEVPTYTIDDKGAPVVDTGEGEDSHTNEAEVKMEITRDNTSEPLHVVPNEAVHTREQPLQTTGTRPNRVRNEGPYCVR